MQTSLAAWIDGTVALDTQIGINIAEMHFNDGEISFREDQRGKGLLLESRTYLGKVVCLMATLSPIYVLATKEHLNMGRLYVCDFRDIQLAPVVQEQGGQNASSRLLRPS